MFLEFESIKLLWNNHETFNHGVLDENTAPQAKKKQKCFILVIHVAVVFDAENQFQYFFILFC